MTDTFVRLHGCPSEEVLLYCSLCRINAIHIKMHSINQIMLDRIFRNLETFKNILNLDNYLL